MEISIVNEIFMFEVLFHINKQFDYEFVFPPNMLIKSMSPSLDGCNTFENKLNNKTHT